MCTLSAREFSAALRAILTRHVIFRVCLENPFSPIRFIAPFSSSGDSVGFGSASNSYSDAFPKIGTKNRALSFGFCGVEEFGESENSGDDDEKSEREEDEHVDTSVRIEKSDAIRAEGYEEEMRSPLVREAQRLTALSPEWNQRLEYELRDVLRSLSPRQVCAILRSFDDERVALKFFYWADRQWRYRHSPAVYYAMLEILGRTRLCQGLRRVHQLMRRRGIHRGPGEFGHLMVSYSRAGKVRNALRVLTMLQKAGVGANLTICNTAVNVMVLAGRLEKAVRFIKEMESFGIEPSVVTYNCLIKGYCGAGRIEDALEMIDGMPERKGCLPDKVSYYTVMGFLCKSKRVEEIHAMMGKMRERGLVPDQVTYNVLVYGFSKNGHGDEALEFLHEGQEKGFRFDKAGYSAVVDSYCKNGEIEKAKKIVAEMFARGYAPDVVTYTSVLDGFCRKGDIEQAKKILREMYKHGCNPNVYSYNVFLNGLIRVGRSSEAREMIRTSQEEGFWTPNSISYSSVMHGLRKEKKLDEACELVEEMIREGFLLGPVEINAMIQSLCLGGETAKARKFMERCLHSGCLVNVVNFTTVIHGFCYDGDVESALSLLDDMYLCNRHPDVITYMTVVSALGKTGRIEEATKLVTEMLRKGLDPTPKMYKTVIHWYCLNRRVYDLHILVEKMLARKDFAAVHNHIIEKLCEFGDLEEADKQLHTVLRTASKHDRDTCQVLMDGYLGKGLPFLACRVANRMFKRNMVPDFELCRRVSESLVLEGKSNDGDNLVLRFVERGLLTPQQLVPHVKRGVLL